MCVKFKAFDSVKQKIVTAPILALPDFQQPFEIETDSSGYAMEIVILIDHHLLQYLRSHNKLQQSRYYRWMGFIQKFHLVIKYKKGVTNKVADMMSRPYFNASVVLQNSSLKLEIYLE